MENKDQIERAKNFILQLAKGINPLTGEIIDGDCIINDINISRELFCTYNVLQDLTYTKRKRNSNCYEEYVYDEEKMSKAKISPYPISLSLIIKNVKDAYEYKCKLSFQMLTELLVEEGILEENPQGNPRHKSTDIAMQYGIFNENIVSYKRSYMCTLYNEDGQKYVYSLLKKYFSK